MTAVDLVIVLLLAGATFGGLRQGFIVQIAAILGALIAFAVARAEYTDVRRVLAQIAPHSIWLTVIAYLIVFLAVWGAIILVARRIRGFMRTLRLGLLDRLGGAVVGFLQGVLVVELLLYLGERVPNHAMQHAVKHALLTPVFLHAIPSLHRLFPTIGT
jgi:membrane protein required for colicin V production